MYSTRHLQATYFSTPSAVHLWNWTFNFQYRVAQYNHKTLSWHWCILWRVSAFSKLLLLIHQWGNFLWIIGLRNGVREHSSCHCCVAPTCDYETAVFCTDVYEQGVRAIIVDFKTKVNTFFDIAVVRKRNWRNEEGSRLHFGKIFLTTYRKVLWPQWHPIWYPFQYTSHCTFGHDLNCLLTDRTHEKNRVVRKWQLNSAILFGSTWSSIMTQPVPSSPVYYVPHVGRRFTHDTWI